MFIRSLRCLIPGIALLLIVSMGLARAESTLNSNHPVYLPLVGGPGPNPPIEDPAMPTDPIPGSTPCLNGQIVGASTNVDGAGYWLVGSDGGVFSFGSALYHGSAAKIALNKPMVAIVPTADAGGYWLVAADGGVFAYGNAAPVADNPLPSMRLNQPIVGAVRAGNGPGLWLVAADGGVFALGGAPFHGSAANIALNKPVIGITGFPDGRGYWLVAADGGVFSYGATHFWGSAVSSECAAPPPPPPGGNLSKVVSIAHDIMNGQAKPGWGGGPVPYSWGGGYGVKPGPSLGTCQWYTGSILPCPADKTVGVDCAGFTRWVYALAFGRDVMGATNTNGQIAKVSKTNTPQPGDLVFFGKSTSSTTHVGIYIGNGRMINAAATGTFIRIDNITGRAGFLGYFHYTP